MLKAIIFDFDGVISKSFEIAYSVAREIHGVSREEYRDFFMGNVYDEKRVNKKSIKHFFSLQSPKFIGRKMQDDIRDGIKMLSEDFDLYIISSNMEETIDEVIRNSHAQDFFDAILGYESGTSKVEKLEHLLNDHHLQSSQCLFVTDTVGDILEARELGVRSIAVDYGFHDRARLKKANPIFVASKFKQVLDRIYSLNI